MLPLVLYFLNLFSSFVAWLLEGEGESEHIVNITLTLKLTQQSSNKRTKEIQEVKN